MKFINRCVVTLKPKAPFVDWATSLGAELPDDWSFEGGAYLLDEQESEEGLQSVIAQHAQAILENELSAWEEDPARWPENRDVELLKAWFHLHCSVAGFDLGAESLMRADLSDLEIM